mgnify:CR=1 FL=1
MILRHGKYAGFTGKGVGMRDNERIIHGFDILVSKHLFGSSGGVNASLFQHDQLIAEFAGKIQVVDDQQHGEITFPVQALHEVQYPHLVRNIQV